MHQERQGFPLQDYFSRISRRYDLINRLFTFGLDRQWRRAAARLILATGPGQVLDLCCGTGDLALALARAGGPQLRITACDANPRMLQAARYKAGAAGFSGVTFRHCDAGELPFPAATFDCIGLSLALRNLVFRNPRRSEYLAGMLRVLKPGGRLVILENSLPRRAWLRFAYRLYLYGFLLPLGGLLSGQWAAYHYLARSSAFFHTAPEICCLLKRAGFVSCSCRRLFGGIVGLFEAHKAK